MSASTGYRGKFVKVKTAKRRKTSSTRWLARQLNDKYGWYLTIRKIAECGLFNLAGLTPLQSSERANLYEVFQYLASKAAEDNLYNEIQKQKK